MTGDQFFELCKECFAEMRASGITSVGEFHYFHHDQGTRFAYDRLILKAAKAVNIRLVLLQAYYQYGGFGHQALNASQERFETKNVTEYWQAFDQLAQEVHECETQTLGVVAHSVRALDLPELKQLHAESVARNLVFHMHVEEQPKEISDCLAHWGTTPIASILSNLAVDSKFTAVHCTWTNESEMQAF